MSFKINLPANMVGKDYVIGDLHGDYDSLMRLLDFVQFNKAVDRLFCVGDLIHRGEKSMECLALLKTRRANGERWFYSTIGNHDVFEDQEMPQFKKWSVDCSQYEFDMKSLPFMYQVEHPVFGYFWVTHGELNSQILFGQNLSQFALNKRDLNSDAELYRNIKRNVQYVLSQEDQMTAKMVEDDLTVAIQDVLLDNDWRPTSQMMFDSIWGRSLFTYFFYYHQNQIINNDFSFLNKYKGRADKLKIFCGHNLVPFPMVIGHQIYCDTGACFGFDKKSGEILKGFSLWGSQFFGLSLIDVNHGTVYTCVSSEKSLVLPDNKHQGHQYQRGDIVALHEPLYRGIFDYN